jgi:formylglycine-generating enzyme required for sulfatase activity
LPWNAASSTLADSLPDHSTFHEDRFMLRQSRSLALVAFVLVPVLALTGCRDGKGTESLRVTAKESLAVMKFVPLPKATFYMGGGGGKAGKKTEIKEGFEIAIHTVTQGQWQAVMGNNPSYFSREGMGKDKVKDISDVDLKQFPVENVSWNDAQEFIKKLNEQEKGKGWVYRLPSEAEWEYACRGGATSEEECSYHFYFEKPTNDLSSKQANFNGETPFGKGDKGPYLERTAKVGSYAPNKLGLYDMHGNLWQSCEDLWEQGGSDRVVRGGSWGLNGQSCQAANRSYVVPTNRGYNGGFRLARVPSGDKQ